MCQKHKVGERGREGERERGKSRISSQMILYSQEKMDMIMDSQRIIRSECPTNMRPIGTPQNKNK